MVKSFKYNHVINRWFSSNDLGFGVFNVFKIQNLMLDELHFRETIAGALKSGLLLDKYIQPRSVDKDHIILSLSPSAYHGPFLLSKIEYEDFYELECKEFFSFVHSQVDESSWGQDFNDLQENLITVASLFQEFNFNENQPIFFINMDKVDLLKQTDHSYTYFFLSVIPMFKENQLCILDLAGD